MTPDSPSPALQKFQALLRELFQYDCADLDFGIYRILNERRGLFEDWLTTRLPAAVKKALDGGAAAQIDAQARKLDELAAALREEHEDAGIIDGDGRLREDIRGRTAREYRELWEARQAAGQPQDREADIYNRLYDFFSRYYEDGDFLSLRRYGADDAYAVPYNGQEVMLHWANRDQYYVKTGEHFTDYRFRAGDGADAWHVEFRLHQAQTDRDNTKSADKRWFFADTAAASIDADTRTLTVPMQWRAATAAEAAALPARNAQDAINADIEKTLLTGRLLKSQPALLAALKADAPDSGDTPRTVLARHLRRYTRRNTSDFFIHKDLRGFLTRELDYWLKAEVLKLDTLLAGEQPARAWLQTLACLREVATTIIDFLARVEDFQKRLYEKRKFVTECHWCITLDHVERAGLTDELVEILNTTESGKAQKAEWKKLFAIHEVKAEGGKPGWKEKVTAEFLRSQPSLVLDTQHVPHSFTDALLESVSNVSQAVDGEALHSDNWHALNLLSERFADSIQCIYIDPPFNTGSDFFYKDAYRFSTWAGLMCERIGVGRRLLAPTGSMFLHLDHNANWLGRQLMDARFGRDNFINEIVWRIGWVSGYKTQVDAFVRNHDTIFLYGKHAEQTYFDKKNARIPYQSFDRESVASEISTIMERWGVDARQVSNIKINFKYPDGRVFKLGLSENAAGYNIEDTWNCSEYEELNSNKIKRNAAEYTPNGSELTQKPEDLLKRAIELTTKPGDVVLDYFAGSGTTAAVAWKLGRKFLTTEMGTHFDHDLLWRVKQIMRGQRVGISRFVPKRETVGLIKYLRLESYEDTLSNLRVRKAEDVQEGFDFDAVPESYRLGYWLDVETAGSASLLDVDKLERPFDYTLRIHDGRESREQAVDLVETFNYLIGLIVRRRRVLDRDGRRYVLVLGRTRADDAPTAVLWRDIKGWTTDDFAAERDWLTAQAPFEDAGVIYVNGDSALPGAQSLDPVFHARMFAPVH